MSHDIIAAAAKGRDWVDYLTLAFIGASAVVLVLYTLYTRRLMQLTRAALEHAQSSSQAALAETRRSNDAAEKNNEIAKRAWLIVNLKARTRKDIDVAADRITELLVLSNLGGVPATDVEIWGRFDLYDKATGIPDRIVPLDGETPDKGIVVGPCKPHELLVHKWDKPLIQREDIHDPTKLYVFYCEITYRDIFDNPRKTIACLQQVPKLNWQDRFDQWVYAPKHNKLT